MVRPDGRVGMSTLNAALQQVRDERQRQDAKFPNQTNVPDGTGGLYRRNSSNRYRKMCDLAFQEGVGSFRDILLEEVYEALAEEPGSAALEAELIQVAAVAVKWVEDIRRRSGR